MKPFQLLNLICAALFLFEMGGANAACAQESHPAKNDSPKTSASAPIKNAAVTVPKVTQVDFAGLQAVLKQNAVDKRPLLVNFWATWCPPCREEFPDLVKIDKEYRPQGLQFVTVSIDDLAEIERDVPAFLAEMKATMPAYLLKTADEETAIHAIAPEWRGALPLTVLYDANGKSVYTKMGPVKPEILRTQIEKLLIVQNQNQSNAPETTILPAKVNKNFEKGRKDAEIDIANGKFVIKTNYLVTSTFVQRMKEYGIIIDSVITSKADEADYMDGYNSFSEIGIKKKFGKEIINQIKRYPLINHPPVIDEVIIKKN
ncbi:MAG: redoxin family protein [Pyrinomonadaceae bacterium]